MQRIVRPLKFSDGTIINKYIDIAGVFKDKSKHQDLLKFIVGRDLENFFSGFHKDDLVNIIINMKARSETPEAIANEIAKKLGVDVDFNDQEQSQSINIISSYNDIETILKGTHKELHMTSGRWNFENVIEIQNPKSIVGLDKHRTSFNIKELIINTKGLVSFENLSIFGEAGEGKIVIKQGDVSFNSVIFDGIEIDLQGGNLNFIEDVTISNADIGIINKGGKVFGEEVIRFENVKQKEKELQEKINKEKQTYICPVTGIEFVFVKGDIFMMGDIWGDGGDYEKPVHEVVLDDFYIGKYPVIEGQWKKVMGEGHFFSVNNYPAIISWKYVQEFIEKLNSMTYGKYRLPYEAEWEYAASWAGEGKRHKWAGTDNKSELKEYAWYEDNSGGKPHPVGLKKPNPLGLYDMSGNVWEWCMDWYDKDYYKISPKKNPTGPNSAKDKYDEYRVVRGGSYRDSPYSLRVAYRNCSSPDFRYYDIGLRLLRTL